MAAFTCGIVIADITHLRAIRSIGHIFLGGIVSILFFILCEKGYEPVNWVLLALIPIYIFIKWVFFNVSLDGSTPNMVNYYDTNDSNDCNTCNEPKPEVKTCPVNPLTLSTECGISRFSNYN